MAFWKLVIFFIRWWWKHFRWTTQEKKHFHYDKFSEYMICAIEVIASALTWQTYQSIPQQPGNRQIARQIVFFPWLLCFQKWKCQSESKIQLCFAYWFRSITSHILVVDFRNQSQFLVKVNVAYLLIKCLKLFNFHLMRQMNDDTAEIRNMEWSVWIPTPQPPPPPISYFRITTSYLKMSGMSCLYV